MPSWLTRSTCQCKFLRLSHSCVDTTCSCGPLHSYEEIVSKYNVVYVAGGAAQNTARGAQYLLPADSTVYFGCVSNDKYANTLKEAAAADGLRTVYQINEQVPTGLCAALITGHNR